MQSNKSALLLLASVEMEETKTTYTRKIHQWKFWKQQQRNMNNKRRKEILSYTLLEEYRNISL